MPANADDDAADLEGVIEDKVLKLHELDARSLSIFIALLIIAVLTTWLFKSRRIRYVHETGLTLIYGAIVGFCVMMFGSTTTDKPLLVQAVNSTGLDWRKYVPTYLAIVAMPMNKTFNYEVVPGYHSSSANGEAYNAPIEERTAFSPEIFYNILLPPIIFNAGYAMKKKQFFRNIGSIMAFAVLGTIISAFFIGYLMLALCSWTIGGVVFSAPELLFFGALISATDPVTVLSIFHDMNVEQDLYAIVMGESVLNDAVAIVLSQTVQQYIPGGGQAAQFEGISDILGAAAHFLTVFFGSFAIGAVIGAMNALFTKFTKIREQPLFETTLFLLMSYLSFLIAESFEMTGIVAILFCGMVQAHYTFNNLSDESRLRTKEFFEVTNFLAESFVFMYIGVSLFTTTSSQFNILFSIYALISVFLARAVHIYGLSFLLNLKRRPKIPANYQHMLVWSGLRGAIAFALALRNTSTKARQYIYTATSIIVTFTVIINGGLTTFVIDRLKILYGADVRSETQRALEAPQPQTDEPTQSAYNPWDKSFLPRKWYHFDSCFMKPLLTNSQPTLMETMPEFMQPLARLLTTTEQMMHMDMRRSSQPQGDANGLDTSEARII